MTDDTTSITPLQAWILATRPKTLPAAAAPVIVGSALAWLDGRFDVLSALAALVGALLLQIGSNVANDLYDFERGADAGERHGPMRVTQAGLLTPQQMRRGMWLIFGLAALVGVYLIWHAGWAILAIGVAAIISAIAYTGGPFPLGYYGLGDLFVFVFFGLAATVGTYYVQALAVTPVVWVMSAVMGLLIVAILVVNNVRDLESDRAAGKYTLAVFLGARGARMEYVLCHLLAYLLTSALVVFGNLPSGALLVLLSIPLSSRLIRQIYTWEGRDLNKTLAGSGQLALIFALLFTLGVALTALRV